MVKFKEWADHNLQGDRVIWAVVFALSLISILVVYSSIGTLAYKHSASPEGLLSAPYLYSICRSGRYVGCAPCGLSLLLHACRKLALWISIPLLIYTFTNGVSLNNAARWIAVPFVGFLSSRRILPVLH